MREADSHEIKMDEQIDNMIVAISVLMMYEKERAMLAEAMVDTSVHPIAVFWT